MHPSVSEPLTRLPDGTVKQRNPFTGTEVWTVPGRGHRPLGLVRPAPQPLDPAQQGRHCAFCEHRLLETPPEKSRIVSTRADDGAPAWQILRHPAAERLEETIPAFRRVPNLFEILSYDYWRLNHGYELPRTRAAAVTSTWPPRPAAPTCAPSSPRSCAPPAAPPRRRRRCPRRS